MQTTNTKRVLILDANQRSALAVCRSLGKQNIPLITADSCRTALAGCSRFSQQYFKYPSPQTKSTDFISAVAEICTKQNIDIVLPMTELTAALLLKHQPSLPEIILPFTDIYTVDSLADKCSLMRLAATLDIPIPQTWHVADVRELPVELDSLNYPVVLKPGKSWLEYHGEWLHSTVQIAQDPADAEHILKSDPAFAAHPFMIQAFIPGKGGGVFTLYDRGIPVAFFAHRRLREKPPEGGVSVLSESSMIDQTLESYARRLLDHANWHGVAMVEFRITPEGKPYLMEINTRFWGSLQLAIDSGIDFPWLLYQACCEMKIQPVYSYKTGKRLRWILGDFDSLYLVLRNKHYSIQEKISAIIQFITPHPFITRHEVNRLDDMKPFFWELKQYINDLRG